MMIFEAPISDLAINQILTSGKEGFVSCNRALQKASGILNFFETEKELEDFTSAVVCTTITLNDVERGEYGDFQTNHNLAQNISKLLKGYAIQPKVIIEPTFGKGSFILAALQTFHNVERIVGVEIYKPYVWQTKFSILDFFLKHSSASKPNIELYHQNVFDFDFKRLGIKEDFLILGNPPWVTNATLTTLGSNNLPKKSNLKNHSGLDAMTGKGNFDIGEFITLILLKTFHQRSGQIAFLVKNTVIKNILQEQKRHHFSISSIQKHTIDTKKEFSVATDAALFFAILGQGKESICTEINFYSQKEVKKLGWVNDKFVSDVAIYGSFSSIDGTCPFEWRQGVKHDCSKIMELESFNDHFINGKQEHIDLEQDLVYGLLKSSDLKELEIASTRKYTIITQKKIGQDTTYIKINFPKTWQYLTDNKSQFDNRKSSIYQGKPPFSIFGIGDYSFSPYKVAISGMYKTTHFSLVLPRENKPIMLDDTCYFIGFETFQDAAITQALLNSQIVQDFLQSIIFWDSKRVITKEILCRIDLKIVVKNLTYVYLHSKNKNITYEGWEHYQRRFEVANQLTLF